MGVFLICWVPFFCVNIAAAFCKTCIPPIVFKCLTWLGYSNSAFNPIIYSIFNLEFREAFQKILTTQFSDSLTTLRSCCGGNGIYQPSSQQFHMNQLRVVQNGQQSTKSNTRQSSGQHLLIVEKVVWSYILDWNIVLTTINHFVLLIKPA